MFDEQFITDARLKAHLAGLVSNQVALRRLQVKLGKKMSFIQKKEVAAGDNEGVKAKMVKSTTRRLSFTNRDRHQLRCEARATHLLRQFLLGKPYKATEQHTKPQTISPAEVIADFLPNHIYVANYQLVEAIEKWSAEA